MVAHSPCVNLYLYIYMNLLNSTCQMWPLYYKSHFVPQEEGEGEIEAPIAPCMNCGEIGHTMLSCPEPFYCTNCGRKGHVAKYCRHTQFRQNAPQELQQQQQPMPEEPMMNMPMMAPQMRFQPRPRSLHLTYINPALLQSGAAAPPYAEAYQNRQRAPLNPADGMAYYREY